MEKEIGPPCGRIGPFHPEVTLQKKTKRVSQKGNFFYMFISFCSSKKKRTKEKGAGNDNFSLFCQNAFGVTLPKKAEVRTISGLPPHLPPEINVNN